MPFTTPEARSMTDTIGPREMGDYCFLAYRDMVRRWKKSRRWTTAHEIYRDMMDMGFPDRNTQIATYLAWQVFFVRHVMTYENEKAAINGEVE
jgi:pentatricopeptide repeat protein